MQTFEDHCAKAEHVFQGTHAEWSAVVPFLYYDQRKDGNKGRCLAADVPELGLLVGDRLEPSDGCPNVGLSPEDIGSSTPMVFWRRMAEEPVRHRNPLWSKVLGITPDIICVDTLHTLCLGVFGVFVSAAMWYLLSSNLFQLPAFLSQEERNIRSMQLLGVELREFYKQSSKSWTRIDELKVEIFGTKTSPALHLKGHQTVGLLHFLNSFMAKSCTMKDAKPWIDGSAALVAFWASLEGSPAILEPKHLKDSLSPENLCQTNNQTHPF